MAVLRDKNRRTLQIGDIVDCDKGRCEIVDKTSIYLVLKDADGAGWLREPNDLRPVQGEG